MPKINTGSKGSPWRALPWRRKRGRTAYTGRCVHCGTHGALIVTGDTLPLARTVFSECTACGLAVTLARR